MDFLACVKGYRKLLHKYIPAEIKFLPGCEPFPLSTAALRQGKMLIRAATFHAHLTYLLLYTAKKPGYTDRKKSLNCNLIGFKPLKVY